MKKKKKIKITKDFQTKFYKENITKPISKVSKRIDNFRDERFKSFNRFSRKVSYLKNESKNNINNFLLSFSKKNFFISLPWFFENNLKKIINKFIDKDNASHIKLIWFDNIQKKYDLSKNYDKNIYY